MSALATISRNDPVGSVGADTADRPVGKLGGDTSAVVVSVAAGEPILRQTEREISILVAREDVTITHARYAAGQQVACPHVHHRHTDAFYVLEGELVFEVGREAETITVTAGGFVAVPPDVGHSFRTGGSRPARWLTIHAHDGGFAAFMRSIRDGGRIDWDIAPVPADGGLPASEATVSRDGSGELLQFGGLPRLRCALPDLYLVDRHLREREQEPPNPCRGDHGTTILVLEGELEATLAATRQVVGPGVLVSAPPGIPLALHPRGAEHARILTLHTPSDDLADHPGAVMRRHGLSPATVKGGIDEREKLPPNQHTHRHDRG